MKSGISRNTVLIMGLFSVGVLFTVAVMPNSLAEPQSQTAETTVIPHSDDTSIEKTTMLLNIPKDNTLPWAYVEGKIDNHAQDYPVIIQFFNEENGDDPIHVAQVDVEDNGSYEYKFRVRDVNMDTGEVTNFFEGDYVVKIFKVVNLQDDISESA